MFILVLMLLLSAGAVRGDQTADEIKVGSYGNGPHDHSDSECPGDETGASCAVDDNLQTAFRMGIGGQCTVFFRDNKVVDGDGDDIEICDGGTLNERINLEVSEDGESFVTDSRYQNLGRTRVQKDCLRIDLKAVELKSVTAVRITDVTGEGEDPVSTGFDIVEVTALNSEQDSL